MFRNLLFALLVLSLLATPLALAQDAKPTVAILRYGPMFNFNLIQRSMMTALSLAGFLSEDEANTILDSGQDLEGENLRITIGDANLNPANIGFIVDEALDTGADALVTFSTPVTLAALNATLDMDDPPVLLFASVFNPYEAGIAQASCIKPAHVTGLESITLYDDIVPLLLLQNPGMKKIGTVYSASETSGRLGAQEIAKRAEALGLTVEQAAVNSVADLAVAAEGLVAKGVEAFLIPSDLLTVAGMPSLMQVGIENSIPVFHSMANAVNDGATVSAGVSQGGMQGRLLGNMLAGALSGKLDISATGIGSVSEITVSVSPDTAELQDVELSEALMARADMIYQDGVTTGTFLPEMLKRAGLPEERIPAIAPLLAKALAGGGISELDLPPQVAQAFRQMQAAQAAQQDIAGALARLRCTDEMIAEQQAALDADEG